MCIVPEHNHEFTYMLMNLARETLDREERMEKSSLSFNSWILSADDGAILGTDDGCAIWLFVSKEIAEMVLSHRTDKERWKVQHVSTKFI